MSFGVINVEPTEDYKEIARRAARLFKTCCAAITIIDKDRQWILAGRHIPFRSTPRSWAFCEHCFDHETIMVVPDTVDNAQFKDNPLVVGEPYIRFYAGAAIRISCGMPLGALCILDTAPRFTPLSHTESMLLMVMADEVAVRLEASRLQRLREELTIESASLGRFSPASHEWWNERYGAHLWGIDVSSPKSPSAARGIRRKLTDQQVKVLTWASRGKSAPEIGIILGLTTRTVRFHLGEAAKRLDAARTSQAIAIAVSEELIPTPSMHG